MRNPNKLRQHTIPYAIYHLCLNNNIGGLTGEQIFEAICVGRANRKPEAEARVPQLLKATHFSDMATSRHLLKMCKENRWIYREKQRNPKSNRMCYYYFAKTDARMQFERERFEASLPLAVLDQDNDSLVLQDEELEVTVNMVSVDTLEAEVWKLVVNHKPMHEVQAAYQKVLNFNSQN